MANRRNPKKSVRAKTSGPFTMDELFRPPRPRSRLGPRVCNQQPKPKPCKQQQPEPDVERPKKRTAAVEPESAAAAGRKACCARALNSGNKYDYVADLNRGVERHPDADRTPVGRDAANCCVTEFCCTIM